MSGHKDALERAAYLSIPAFSALAGLQTGALPERSTPAVDASVSLLFEHEGRARSGESIFSPRRVQAMCEIEAVFTSHVLYPHLCILNETGGCADQSLSAAALFYPAAADRDPSRGGCALLPAAAVAARARAVLSDFFTSTNGFFATAGAQPGGHTNASRSLLRLGAPLRGCILLSASSLPLTIGRTRLAFYQTLTSSLGAAFDQPSVVRPGTRTRRTASRSSGPSTAPS